MKGKPGRPMKYGRFLEALEDREVYCPSSIVRHGNAQGLFGTLEGEALRIAKQRVRITLGRLSSNHDFPVGGDGLVIIKGQAPIPGWLGTRWKSLLIRHPPKLAQIEDSA